LAQQLATTKNEEVAIAILKLLQKEKNQLLTFRDIMVGLRDTGTQEIWNSLRYLQQEKIIESVKVSNRHGRYNIGMPLTNLFLTGHLINLCQLTY
jgi:Fe2+ or Zn2+ uptake regulation protein